MYVAFLVCTIVLQSVFDFFLCPPVFYLFLAIYDMFIVAGRQAEALPGHTRGGPGGTCVHGPSVAGTTVCTE